jgi:hypothetical protein
MMSSNLFLIRRIHGTRLADGRVQVKCDGTKGEELEGKLANGVGSQYSSHYLGTWRIQHN